MFTQIRDEKNGEWISKRGGSILINPSMFLSRSYRAIATASSGREPALKNEIVKNLSGQKNLPSNFTYVSCSGQYHGLDQLTFDLLKVRFNAGLQSTHGSN